MTSSAIVVLTAFLDSPNLPKEGLSGLKRNLITFRGTGKKRTENTKYDLNDVLSYQIIFWLPVAFQCTLNVLNQSQV